MKWIATLLLGFAFLGRADAHVLDEYFQGTYIAVQSGRIDVEIDLTPGVEVFQKVLRLIDRDGDGKISDQEIREYAQKVLSAAKFGLDGSAKRLQLVHVTLPAREDLEEGLKAIRIQSRVDIPALETGPHHIEYTNAHAPEISAYQVNALAPSIPGIRITKQTRDELQREYRMDFDVSLNGKK